MKKILILGGAIAMLAATAGAAAPKYVFLFIGDGMATTQRMLAEEFSLATGQGELVCNHFKCHATTRTCSVTSLVTDSSAAATAIACGVKTYNGAAGLDKDGKRVESVAELAHAKGKKVGIVTTATINHATPSGFYAHRKHRGLLYEIGLDLVASGFDYFAGGGFEGKHNDVKNPAYRGNLFDLAAKAGYTVATNLVQFKALKPGKLALYCGGDGDELQYSIDADGSEPSLAELTSKGIELLDGPQGFFMMVEGGKIDHAGHDNDAATNMRDTLAFDQAVIVARDFMVKHPGEVLIITTGDHETGGMSLGRVGTGYAIHPRRLARQRCSGETFAKRVKAAKAAAKAAGRHFDFAEVKPMLERDFGFDFSLKKSDAADRRAGGKFAGKAAAAGEDEVVLTRNDIRELEEGFKRGQLAQVATRIISAKAGIGWSSGAHTALPVLSASEGVYAERFTGFMENTDISRLLKAMYNE